MRTEYLFGGKPVQIKEVRENKEQYMKLLLEADPDSKVVLAKIKFKHIKKYIKN